MADARREGNGGAAAKEAEEAGDKLGLGRVAARARTAHSQVNMTLPSWSQPSLSVAHGRRMSSAEPVLQPPARFLSPRHPSGPKISTLQVTARWSLLNLHLGASANRFGSAKSRRSPYRRKRLLDADRYLLGSKPEILQTNGFDVERQSCLGAKVAESERRAKQVR